MSVGFRESFVWCARKKGKRKKIHTQCCSQQKYLNYIWHTYILRSHIGLSLPRAADGAAGVGPHARRGKLRQRASATRRPIGKISAKCCSFSAVSAPIFARKYAFVSIFQNLPDFQAEIFEIWQILQISRHNDLQNFFAAFSRNSLIFQTVFFFLLEFWDCSGAKSMQIL